MKKKRRTIQILARKGGAGKTTLSIHLAAAAAAQGLAVAIIDADEQGSALAWADRRDPAAPPILVLAAGHDLAATCARIDADLILIDSPPTARASGGTWRPDRIIVPIQPSALDLAALGATLALIAGQELSALAVLTRVPPRGREGADARAFVRRAGLRVARAEIGERRDYARALATGSAATEFAPRGQAAAEITQLLKEVLR